MEFGSLTSGGSGGIDCSYGETTRPIGVDSGGKLVYHNDVWKEFLGEHQDGI